MDLNQRLVVEDVSDSIELFHFRGYENCREGTFSNMFLPSMSVGDLSNRKEFACLRKGLGVSDSKQEVYRGFPVKLDRYQALVKSST